MNFNYLSLIIFLPVVGALVVGLIPGLSSKAIKYISAVFAFAVLALSVVLLFKFDRAAGGMQFVENYSWIPALSAHYHLGVDGISLPLLALTALLGFIAVLMSWKVESRTREFFVWLLILESSVLGVFCALDLLLFFIFWEVEVIPVYFLISIWGSGNKRYSATKYVIFTLAGSALMLAGILALYYATGSLDMSAIASSGQALTQSVLPAAPIFFLLLAGFAVKLPIVPFHTWQPDAYADAPIAVSVMLAGSLAKMGGYGMIRLCVSMFPTVAHRYAPLMLTLAVIGIIYGGAVAFRQTNLKRLIAYSSISHMGFVLLGIFALTQTSLVGASLQMVSHGLITGLMFAVAGIIIENTGEQEIPRLDGLARQMPSAATFLLLAGLGTLGLPSTSGFAAEFTTFLGSFGSAVAGAEPFVLVALLGVLLAAGYVLWMLQRVIFGPVMPVFNDAKDANKLQRFYCGALVALIFLVGIYPTVLVSIIQTGATGVVRLLGG